MRRPVLTACLLVLLALLGACGGGDSQAEETALLARSEAQRLNERLGRIEELIAQDRCDAARDNVDDFTRQVEALSDARDAGLRDRLREGAENLDRTVAECEPRTEPTQTTDTAPVEPEPAPEPVPETTPTEPVPTTPTAPDGGGGESGGEDGEGGGGDEDDGSSGGGNGGGQGPGGTPPGQVPDGSGGAQAPGLSRGRGSGE